MWCSAPLTPSDLGENVNFDDMMAMKIAIARASLGDLMVGATHGDWSKESKQGNCGVR